MEAPEPLLTPKVLEMLETLERGEELGVEHWSATHWRIGQPCYAAFVDPAGGVHLYPARVTEFEPQESGAPKVSVHLQPTKGWDFLFEPHYLAIRMIFPREVNGEEW